LKKKLFLLASFLGLLVFSNSVQAAEVALDTDKQPLEYGKKYYVSTIENMEKGGLTFEPYLSFDNLLFANSPSNRGTAMVIQGEGKSPGTVIGKNDTVSIINDNANWKGRSYWAPRQSMGNGITKQIILQTKPYMFQIVSDNDNPDRINFAWTDMEVSGMQVGFYSTFVKPRKLGDKLWLSQYRYLYYTKKQPNAEDLAKVPKTIRLTPIDSPQPPYVN